MYINIYIYKIYVHTYVTYIYIIRSYDGKMANKWDDYDPSK